MRFKKIINSIAFRTSVTIAVLIVSTTIAVGWLMLREEKKVLEAELRNKGRYLAEIMSYNVVEPLLYEERHAIFSLLQVAMKSRESLIVYAEVYDKDRERVVSAYKDERFRSIALPPYRFNDTTDGIDIREDENLPVYRVSMPVNIETLGTIGFLRLCITKEFLYSTIKAMQKKLYLLAAGVILVGIVPGLWMARNILRPILILNNGVKMIAEGEVGVEVPVVGEGEIRELAMSFNMMSRKLKDLINTIKSAQEHLIRTEKLYAVGEFSAGVAHEIKNPLTSIKMLMQTVKRKRQALTDEDIDVIEGEINRIDHIVKEFLAFARPEKTEKTDVNINDILEEVMTVTMPMIEQSSIHLVRTFSSSLPLIRGSHDALRQVFLNIVLNAMQAMDKWSGTLEIVTGYESGVMGRELSEVSGSHKVIVTIRDTGPGIPEENINRVFDPFFTTKEEGTGMGLAITHNIVNDHSGKIEIDSTRGKGTTVKVEFPLIREKYL
ncbi:MAG TPA: sensor histidine kinase [Nitrospirae bacterium]|nr:sensor histidine kinase [Nitrospirota bacterium]